MKRWRIALSMTFLLVAAGVAMSQNSGDGQSDAYDNGAGRQSSYTDSGYGDYYSDDLDFDYDTNWWGDRETEYDTDWFSDDELEVEGGPWYRDDRVGWSSDESGWYDSGPDYYDYRTNDSWFDDWF